MKNPLIQEVRDSREAFAVNFNFDFHRCSIKFKILGLTRITSDTGLNGIQ